MSGQSVTKKIDQLQFNQELQTSLLVSVGTNLQNLSVQVPDPAIPKEIKISNKLEYKQMEALQNELYSKKKDIENSYVELQGFFKKPLKLIQEDLKGRIEPIEKAIDSIKSERSRFETAEYKEAQRIQREAEEKQKRERKALEEEKARREREGKGTAVVERKLFENAVGPTAAIPVVIDKKTKLIKDLTLDLSGYLRLWVLSHTDVFNDEEIMILLQPIFQLFSAAGIDLDEKAVKKLKEKLSFGLRTVAYKIKLPPAAIDVKVNPKLLQEYEPGAYEYGTIEEVAEKKRSRS